MLGMQKGTKQSRREAWSRLQQASRFGGFFFLCPSVLFPFYTLLFKSGEIPRLRVWEWTEAEAKARTV